MPTADGIDALYTARAETDRRLTAAMAAAQSGDRSAYETVLRECVPLVQRMARHYGALDEFLDDVVQDVLLTMHGARASYDPSRSFIAWITAITQRRTIDILRRRGRRSTREIHAPGTTDRYPASDNPELEAILRSEVQQLHALVAELPERQREAVRSLALEERTLEDASRSTGRTKTALKVNLHRAIIALRSRIVQAWNPLRLTPSTAHMRLMGNSAFFASMNVNLIDFPPWRKKRWPS